MIARANLSALDTPHGFDPLRAAASELQDHGFPPRPDREIQPGLYRIFNLMFSRPFEFITPQFEPSGDNFLTQPRLQTSPGAYRVPPDSTAGAATNYETSSNWSGAYVVPSDGTMFVQVFGLWTVPRPSPPPPPDEVPAGPDAEYACTTWIGFDGQRLYPNSSLPQTGTRQNLSVAANGVQTIRTLAWIQWWTRDFPNASPSDIPNFPVEPDDQVAFLLRVKGPRDVSVSIRNLSTNQLTRLDMTMPDPTLQISGATAEWIMETPTVLNSNPPRLHNFPAYNTMEFVDCVASAAIAPGQPETPHILQGAEFIRMFKVRDNPESTAFISVPEKRSDLAVRLTYGGFPV